MKYKAFREFAILSKIQEIPEPRPHLCSLMSLRIDNEASNWKTENCKAFLLSEDQ